ncbi:AAA family ATPase [Devosia sp.]|uniref:AAA family ATPase n=1 Tax=Devosia sp. TaxID=1871048 RepID=UPI003BABE392
MPTTSTFKLLSPADIEALPDLEWLVRGVLPAPAFAVLYGEPGCGKSFVALSMALAVASGGEWLGRPVKQAKVLYVAAEGVLGLKNRLRANRRLRGISEENLRFVADPVMVADSTQVIALVRDLAAEGFAPGLIIVDTLARVAVGVDENSAKEIGVVIAGFDDLKRATDATVLVIHHTRKDGVSERGSGALRGAADVMIQCEKSGDDMSRVSLSCSKMKDDEPFKTVTAFLEKVDLSNGASSLVLGGLAEAFGLESAHADAIIWILETQFADKGATHGALKKAFVAAGNGSESKFDRAWRDLKDTARVRLERVGGKALIFTGSVSVNPVSNQYQTPTQTSVMSPPSLGGDTDTKSAT